MTTIPRCRASAAACSSDLAKAVTGCCGAMFAGTPPGKPITKGGSGEATTTCAVAPGLNIVRVVSAGNASAGCVPSAVVPEVVD